MRGEVSNIKYRQEGWWGQVYGCQVALLTDMVCHFTAANHPTPFGHTHYHSSTKPCGQKPDDERRGQFLIQSMVKKGGGAGGTVD